MDSARLLHQPCLSLITREGDDLLGEIRNAISKPVLVDGRADVERVLSDLSLAGDSAPKTLDLIGHSTPDRSLLILGDWVIDGTSAKVLSFFRGLADCEVLPRIGVHAVRLLGCETATTEIGRRTILALAEILELEIYGTRQSVGPTSYGESGFLDGALLVSATDLRQEPLLSMVKRGGEPYQRTLDVELLPASPLGTRRPHPRRLLDLSTARKVLTLIRRTAGAQMPGAPIPPTFELALPSITKRGWHHRLDVLLEGEFVRAYPDGDDRPGVVFPVSDSRLLRELITALPEA